MKTGDLFDEDWGQQTPGGTLFLGTVPKIHHIWWEYEQNSSSFYQVWYFKWLIMNLQLSLLSPPTSPNSTTCFQHNSHILMGTINTTLSRSKSGAKLMQFCSVCAQKMGRRVGLGGVKRSYRAPGGRVNSWGCGWKVFKEELLYLWYYFRCKHKNKFYSACKKF